MQHPPLANPAVQFGPNTTVRRWFLLSTVALLAFGLLLATTGCGGDSIRPASATAKPFTSVSLTLRCPDTTFATAITPALKSWATRTGATVTIAPGPMMPGDDSDIGIIPSCEFGAWADRGDLAPVPTVLRAADNSFQWTGLLPPYREHLIEWGGQARAVPLAGEGFVIVYRADRLAEPNFVAAFQKRSGSKPAAPATWEEFADLAATFAEIDGKPSLPPMTGAEIADLFFRLAACYDHRPTFNTEAVAKQGGEAILSFLHDIRTGDPRLSAPGFAAAAEWLAGLAANKCLPPSPAAGAPSNPAAELASGKAALAVLSLSQLAKWPRENGAVPAKFAIAPLPGTRRYTDPDKQQLVRVATPNYAPYFSGGRLGLVRNRCSNTDAAFELLADLGGPIRSQETLSNPELGAGPFRSSHLEQDRLLIWLGYRFDADRSKALQRALVQNVRMDVKNPVYGLRGPDQKELNDAAAEELAKIATGTVPADAGLKQLIAAWQRIDQKTPKETRIRWRKLSAGVE